MTILNPEGGIIDVSFTNQPHTMHTLSWKAESCPSDHQTLNVIHLRVQCQLCQHIVHIASCSDQSHFQRMSGKAGELVPTYQSQIFPVAPPSSPARPTPPTWVARVPSPQGLAAMKNCQDIIARMKATSKAERKGKKLTKTLAGVSGTWYIWKFVDVGETSEGKQQKGWWCRQR